MHAFDRYTHKHQKIDNNQQVWQMNFRIIMNKYKFGKFIFLNVYSTVCYTCTIKIINWHNIIKIINFCIP